jgi:hypothetical protein
VNFVIREETASKSGANDVLNLASLCLSTARFAALTAVLLKTPPCRQVFSYRRFEGSQWLHLQGPGIKFLHFIYSFRNGSSSY